MGSTNFLDDISTLVMKSPPGSNIASSPTALPLSHPPAFLPKRRNARTSVSVYTMPTNSLQPRYIDPFNINTLPEPNDGAKQNAIECSQAVMALPPRLSQPRPRRQAAGAANYDLREAWGTFDHFLTESVSSDSQYDESQFDRASKPNPELFKRNYRKRERSEALSDDETQSDVYKSGGSDSRKRGKGLRKPRSKGTGRKKVRVPRKLDRADLEVIGGIDRPKISGRKKNEKGRLTNLTKGQARTMVDFLLVNTDWQEATRCINAASIVNQQQVSVPNAEASTPIEPSWAIGNSEWRKTADQLTKHWKEDLSWRLVDLYAD